MALGPIATTLMLIVVGSSSGAVINLLSGGDFESADVTQFWRCNGCTISVVSGGRTGGHSLKIVHRSHDYSGPEQTFPAIAGHKYFIHGFVKLLNVSPGKLYHTVGVSLDVGVDATGKHHYDAIGHTTKIQPGIWSEIGGDYVMPSYVNGHARLYIAIEETDVNYEIDDFTVQEIIPVSNFKTVANERIDQLRKQDLYIDLEGSLKPTGLLVELAQTSSVFPLGSAVGAAAIVDPALKKYQDFFYSNFNWAVIDNALKWPFMERTQGVINYDTPEKAIDSLRSRGIKVRGHNIFWGRATDQPSWLQQLSTVELRNAMEARIHGVVGYFKGKLEHWDVNNENIHLDWYEQKLHDPNITQWMFSETHRVDPQVKLFLNDNGVVSSSLGTYSYINQAVMFKAANLPVYGVGVQCHLGVVDLDLIKHRLDEIARVGYPIWVTELDINNLNETLKAQHYEDVLRLLFSHPAVEGIILWGFWDHTKRQRPQSSIAYGDDVMPNEAGKRFQTLIHQEWRTQETLTLTGDQLHLRGFKGDYSIKVLHGSHVIKQENVTLGDSPLHLRIPLTGSGTDPHVTGIIVG